ncbi:hypothetical protein LASUN_16070 [Lentilactobacillus sunkii]|jgi:hypothetical protein|uniref:Uncharacterized protein n=1 Tax=Lentilactobacillus sunkii TaxID=481719 RepID=A0A1E7XCE2_9LACO|nr:hypothetical protein [Lentilactobacillus sunkii]OFA10701.1 hypothetical protein LASUN_16070 [Lentilactobacillus sunkii]
MKKQTILYSLTLAALAAGTYAAYRSNAKYEKYLTAIVKDTKHSTAMKGYKYMGSWSIFPSSDSNTAIFQFGFNYLDQNGNHKTEEFWINSATKGLVKHQVVSL